MTDQQQSPLTIHLISHNHWDREWIFTARYTNRWLPPFFRNIFEMMEREPDYRFVLDGQTAKHWFAICRSGTKSRTGTEV